MDPYLQLKSLAGAIAQHPQTKPKEKVALVGARNMNKLGFMAVAAAMLATADMKFNRTLDSTYRKGHNRGKHKGAFGKSKTKRIK